MDQAALATRLAFYRAVTWGLAVSGDRLTRLTAPPWRADPYRTYADLRSGPAVYRSRAGMAVVSTHELCHQVLRDRRFGVRTTDGTLPEPFTATPLPTDHPATPTFLERDPPDHSRLRALARPAFGPGRIEGYRASVVKTTTRLLDAATAKPRFDLIADFAAPLPIAVISDLMGIPDVDAARFTHYGRVLGGALDGVRTLRHARALRTATSSLREMFTALIDRRRETPGEDVISTLATADLSADDLIATCELLLIAGFETTTNLIANAAWTLARHPDVWERMREEPEITPAVVEEVLRYEPPVQMTQRVPHEDVDLAGHRLRKDTFVVVLMASAGRDPAAFTSPETFDPDRTDEKDHLAFSSGIHYCLGAPLARMEADVALRALATRLPNLKITGKPKWRPTTVIRGLRNLRLQTL
ncbi:cytochrome P450 [Actinokineospora sp. UTMC 2448]|uniref:cytochrome P450 n=1 Tax=Actinokineospora sp. UTMC 2448 TaxID=2268449 RepID=UPI0021640E22|nr:cytochrome P450 [Actinokineospora sp. UTMC 2448]UVS82312.1 Biotin biosynthesis cytochrome P450 [Actinokineospora sp. UTMC 2448]